MLLAYGAQYMRLKKLKDPADLCLMVIADRIPPSFVGQVELLQGSFTQVGNGLWRGELAGAALHGVETGKAAKRGPTEALLYMFSKAFLRNPRGGLPLDEDARRVYALLWNQVEQFRKIRGATAMKDYELAKMSMAELMQPTLERMVEEEPQKLARMIPPEELVKALTPEELAKALTPEQLAKALTPEQLTKVFDALPPDVREQIMRRRH